jgi:hypothetical protein
LGQLAAIKTELVYKKFPDFLDVFPDSEPEAEPEKPYYQDAMETAKALGHPIS